MAQSDGQGVVRRQDFLKHQNSHEVVIQEGYFLTPSFPIGKTPLPELRIGAIPWTRELDFSDDKLSVDVDYYGWQNPDPNWCQWIDDMLLIHRDTWERAGISEAIQATKFNIYRRPDIILGLAEKWHPETNTFVFPWGEASITLEDVCILGGFSVTGDPVPHSVRSDPIMTRVQERFSEVNKILHIPPIRKATYSIWLKTFTNKDDDRYRDIEHEAFLIYWLSKYVFPEAKDTVGIHVVATAIHLAKGTRIALAPAVLASLYSDMRNMREVISSRLVPRREVIGLSTNYLRSPMQLLQLWAWERFHVLRPNPNNSGVGYPRVVRWHDLKPKDIDDIPRVLDEARSEFNWRPYCTVSNIWAYEFHETNNNWIWMEADVRRGHKLEAFAMFIRHSELVSFWRGTIEQYLPHRVARQFGMDQDIPDDVPRFNETIEIAWSQYNRSLEGTKLYIPPRVCDSKVTVRYSSWWKNIQEENNKELERTIEKKRKYVDGEGSGKDH